MLAASTAAAQFKIGGPAATVPCPLGYVFVDKKYRFSGLRDPEELYEMRGFRDDDWPLGDYETLAPYNQTRVWKVPLA